jgi:hypothetical protein
MATIITREVGATAKGSPLSNAEMDANLISLNTNKLEASNIVPLHGVDISTDELGNVIIDVKNFGGNCKNTTTSSIPKGTPVYQTGVVGVDTPTVAPADASDPLKMPAIGVLGETIAADAEGDIIYLGNIKGVDTSAFGIGDEVYVASGGGYTNTKPANGSGVLIQFLGVVNRVSTNNGSGIIFGTATSQTQSVETTDAVQFAQVTVDNLTLDQNTVSASGNLILAPTGYVDANAKRITNLAVPTSASDAATKQYVDEAAEGLRSKPAARAATTTNLAAVYDNGTAGVGATLTADTNRVFTTLDGVTGWAITTPPMGVLIKNQTNPAHNGRYNLTSLGETGVSPWVLTRCGLCDQANEIPGSYTFVQFGTANGGTGWVQTVADPSTFTVGTDAIILFQFSGAGTYTAGTGLTLTGTQFALADTAITPGTYGSSTQIPQVTIDQQGRITSASTNSITVGDGTLTVNTSGTGLTGSGTFGANSATNQTITITSNATSANTASTLVARDASGNFVAGTITAELAGNASTATTWQTARTLALSGDVTGSASVNGGSNVTIAATLPASGVTAGTYGSSTQIPQITVDAKGRVTSAAFNSLSVGEGVLTVNTSGIGLTGSGTFGANSTTNPTITITSNATSANTASTLVARDASGNFTAGTITAALTGNASTATTLATARTLTIGSTGKTFNGGANVAWTLAEIGAQAAGNYVTTDTAQTITGSKNFPSDTADGTIPTLFKAGRDSSQYVSFYGNANGNRVISVSTSTNPKDFALRVTDTVTTGVFGFSRAGVLTANSFSGALNATDLTSGTLADARLAGTYSGFSHKLDGNTTIFTIPNTGSTTTVARTVYGLAEYKSAASAQVGAIVFIAPNTTSNIMHQLEIQGLLYNQNIVRLTVQGYRTTGAWSDLRKISFGTVDIQTRWAVTPDGKNCLVLGDVGTTWSYPHLSVVRALFSHSGANDDYAKGWTVAVLTDLSTYTQLSANIADSPLTGSITGSAATLTTARTINGTSFNGSANITTANWGTARTVWGQSINGSANITAPVLPAAGSVTAPAFSTSGNTNTGIFFPAADTIAFAEGGAEAMRIDSAGNVGIGTSSPGAKLDIKGLARSSIGTGTGAGGAGYAFYQFGTSATATENWHIGTEGDGSFRFYNQGFGAGLERMRIDSAGNVGIGTSSPKAQIHVRGAGQSGTTVTDAGLRGGSLRLIDSNTDINSGGMIAFGSEQADTAASSVGFAAIKGKLSNAIANTLGSISFQTRSAAAATSLTERMNISSSGVSISTLTGTNLDFINARATNLSINALGGTDVTFEGGNALLYGTEASYDAWIPTPNFIEETVYLDIYVAATYWNGTTTYNRMTRHFVVTLIGNTSDTVTIANQTAAEGYASDTTNFPVGRAAVVAADGTAYLRFTRRTSSAAASITEFNYLIQAVSSTRAF